MTGGGWRGPLHQVVVSTSPGDAITTSVLRTRAVIRRKVPSEVFAFHVHPAFAGDIHRVEDYKAYTRGQSCSTTLVHVSMGDDRFLPFVASLPGRLVIMYHNLTPAEYFTAWSPELARLLRVGRAAVPLLKDRTVLALSNSEFSAAELREFGFADVRVGGLLLDSVSALQLVEPDVEVTERIRRDNGPVVLSVGQLYPHKRPDLVAAAGYLLTRRLRPDARVVLAGAARLATYAAAIRGYVDRLGAGGQVLITGEQTPEQMAAWFRAADVFVAASEHEGFCVPLVEAMQFDLPIVARANAAIPETLGGAGLLLPGDAGPSALATTVAALLDDADAQEEMRRLNKSRLASFDPATREQELLDALESVGS